MPDFATLVPIAVSGLAFCAGLAFLTWIASVARRDASLVDRMWSLMIAGPAVVYAAQSSWSSPRAIALLVLVLAWGLRLSAYITWRNWGHGEDRRYQQIRARNQPHFALKSLWLIFALQMVLAWIVSPPTLAALAGERAFGPPHVAGIGVVIAVAGFLFEAIGDAQMAAFKRDPANQGQVMDRGLWRHTRHPNYFGEACFWWGVWLIALAAGGAAATWTVLSPLLMTVLLLKVSGVAMLEKDIGERRPAYRDYIARTNAFIPGPRKETSA